MSPFLLSFFFYFSPILFFSYSYFLHFPLLLLLVFPGFVCLFFPFFFFLFPPLSFPIPLTLMAPGKSVWRARSMTRGQMPCRVGSRQDWSRDREQITRLPMKCVTNTSYFKFKGPQGVASLNKSLSPSKSGQQIMAVPVLEAALASHPYLDRPLAAVVAAAPSQEAGRRRCRPQLDLPHG